MNCPSCSKLYGTNPIECDECLQYVNWSRLIVTPVGTDKDGNIGHALENTTKYIDRFYPPPYSASLQDLFLFLKRMEAITAGASLAYSRRKVQERIPNPKDLESSEGEWNEAIKKQKDAQRPKKERVLLSDRDKGIKHLMTNLKMSLEMASKIVDEQMSKEGRNPGIN